MCACVCARVCVNVYVCGCVCEREKERESLSLRKDCWIQMVEDFFGLKKFEKRKNKISEKRFDSDTVREK